MIEQTFNDCHFKIKLTDYCNICCFSLFCVIVNQSFWFWTVDQIEQLTPRH